MRNVLGSLIALIGAAATLVSPWKPWYNNRHGSDYKFYEVFGSGITVSRSGVMDSVFLVFLVTAIVAVVGVVLRSRALVLGAGVVAFGFAILWMIRQGQAAGELTITGANNRGLGTGLAYAFGGGLLMIIGALIMTGRPRQTVVAERSGTARTADQTAYGAAATTTAAPAAPATTSAPPAITTTAPANKNRAAQPSAPIQQEQTPAETTPASQRTGTERLSKEERQMLGLDEEASAEQKKQD
ncbi:hypothetical protein ABH926_001701 [Catenulispora sp. GP43]|uniref:hypothetical protein n=1 Tax=Catenulispora sp. GP43 TaxID=3156263 RepID=UPI0035137D02